MGAILTSGPAGQQQQLREREMQHQGRMLHCLLLHCEECSPWRAHACALRTVPQANNVAHKLQHANGASVAVSASALGSKDSLYTIHDAPAAPSHRITAAPSQVGWGSGGLQKDGCCTCRRCALVQLGALADGWTVTDQPQASAAPAS